MYQKKRDARVELFSFAHKTHWALNFLVAVAVVVS